MALHGATMVRSRVAGVLQVIRSAAAGDREIDSLWKRIQSEFYENQRAIIESLSDNGDLSLDLSVKSATDILWSLNHPSTYLLFVVERQWSPNEFEDWLADLLQDRLRRSG